MGGEDTVQRYARLIRYVVLGAVSAAMGACGSSAGPATPGGGEPVAAQVFDVGIESPAPDNFFGGATTRIAATVFVPTHRAGESYPLILHSHGWGGDRITAEDAANNPPDDAPTGFYSAILDRQVKHLWDAGYAVISFDERGFGDSGGASRVMDPEYETRDAIAILDWAEENLALSRDASGDPYVGTIGGSYGGGFQLLLAARDPRVDALAPGATWYDLMQSLAPNGVIKKLYDFGLCLSAVQARRRLDPMTLQVCTEAGLNPGTKYDEQVSAAAREFLAAHGMGRVEARHVDPNDDFRMRKVDALFVQGNRDVLFPIDQALANVRFLQSLGGDVRLLTNEHGHYIGPPLSSQPPLGWWGCGPHDSIGLIRDWFDAKLRGQAQKLAGIPRLCLSLDDDHALELDAMPVADETFTIDIEAITVTGLQNDFGGLAPSFVPLADVLTGDDWVLAGSPVADLQIGSPLPGTDAAAFVGIGLRAADGSVRLVDDQITPLRAGHEHADRRLYAIGERITAGEVPGVLLYGAFHQYEPAAKTNFQANAYTVSGTVRLPLRRATSMVRQP